MTREEEQREIARARERADLARLRFGNAVSGVLDRLHPDHLRAEVIEIATDQLDQTRRELLQRFRHWPALMGAAAAAGLAITFWRPARVAAGYAVRVAGFLWSTRDMWRRKT